MHLVMLVSHHKMPSKKQCLLGIVSRVEKDEEDRVQVVIDVTNNTKDLIYGCLTHKREDFKLRSSPKGAPIEFVLNLSTNRKLPISIPMLSANSLLRGTCFASIAEGNIIVVDTSVFYDPEVYRPEKMVTMTFIRAVRVMMWTMLELLCTSLQTSKMMKTGTIPQNQSR